MTSGTADGCNVDIFYHIRQVAACIAKLVLWGAFRILILGTDGRRRSAMVPFERAMVVSYRPPLWHCAICNHSAANCHRMSSTLKSTGGGSLWGKILGGWGGLIQPNLKAIWDRDLGCRMQKKSCRYFLPFEHNARTWYTHRQIMER